MRIHTPLTVHAEITSIRGRRNGGRIRYRVADEYESKYAIRPQTSKLPLTMGEVIRLINTADNGHCPNGLIIEFREDHIAYEFIEDYLRDSVVVESDYYPQNEERALDSTSDRDDCGDFSDACEGTQCPSPGRP